jgi:hypothetical protein
MYLNVETGGYPKFYNGKIKKNPAKKKQNEYPPTQQTIIPPIPPTPPPRTPQLTNLPSYINT